ncbi:hypothetical protein SBOR_5088 [Sclerotinia borealis F-4128]|uniref:Uncharacterized protein n=1 Tax=Sclerotinia borealis (strain F-4128) TaxID=1432307 RepID=W9CJ36_SCLBF|nr:hypothetical protein SBOR_5088 [Sclerotinia borealis F-4128]
MGRYELLICTARHAKTAKRGRNEKMKDIQYHTVQNSSNNICDLATLHGMVWHDLARSGMVWSETERKDMMHSKEYRIGQDMT